MSAIVVLYARPAADFGSTVPATLTNAPSVAAAAKQEAPRLLLVGSFQPNVL